MMRSIRVSSRYWLECVASHGNDFRINWATVISG